MKKIIISLFLLSSVANYAQDTIINYLNAKGRITSIENTSAVRMLIKKDSLWQLTLHDRYGNLLAIGMFKTKNFKVPQGQYKTFARNGNLVNILNHNKKGDRQGATRSWFDDGSISVKGNYDNDKKTGNWRYYHHNGKLANKVFYLKDSIIKYTVYDENGNLSKDTIINRKAYFKRGDDKFRKLIQRNLLSKITYKLNGKTQVTFIVGINGKIEDVYLDDFLPKKLRGQIFKFFMGLPAWEPRIRMNRKIKTSITVPLTFQEK